jgi:hypothetical protein
MPEAGYLLRKRVYLAHSFGGQKYKIEQPHWFSLL